MNNILALKVDEINTVKGILIILIVIGHNSIVTYEYNFIHKVIYNFHVVGFFFIAFQYAPKKISWTNTADRAVRYLWPFLVFYSMTSSFYYLAFDNSDIDLAGWMINFFIGAFSSFSLALDKSSGFQLFWFLPTFFVLLILKDFWYNLSKINKFNFFIVCIVIHSTVSLFPVNIFYFFPLGFPVALYLFPVCLTGNLILLMIKKEGIEKNFSLLFLIFAFFVAAGIYLGTNVNIALINVPNIYSIWKIIFHDAYFWASFLFVVSLALKVCKFSLLRLIGRYSLFIYLTHSIFYQMIIRVFHHLDFFYTTFDKWEQVLVTFFPTFLLSYLMSLFFDKIHFFRELIFPENVEGWIFYKFFGKNLLRQN